MRTITTGSPLSPLWLVGEAPGANEEAAGRPFIGPAGYLLDGCLAEAGIQRNECYLTNVCHERPPSYVNKKGKTVVNDIEQFFVSATAARKRGGDTVAVNGRHALPPVARGLDCLKDQIAQYHPRVVVLLGNTPLWGLAGETGITKWRGSVLRFAASSGPPTILVAAFHPADCLPNRSPQHRSLLVHDLERARRLLMYPEFVDPPRWDFTIPTTIEEIAEWIRNSAGGKLACDIETRWNQIACLGLASTTSRAMCIPFLTAQTTQYGHSYWNFETEFSVLKLLGEVLVERPLIFHNGIYDCQYIAARWGFMPNHADDTMVMQHVAFPGFLGGKINPVTGRVDKRGSSLSLSFISSLYCRHHRFWKDDGRQWDPAIHDERRFWNYNMEDCCRTLECASVLEDILAKAKLTTQYRFIMRTHEPVYKMMFRGFRVDRDAMLRMHSACGDGMDSDRRWLAAVTRNPELNPASSQQISNLFYRDLQQTPIYKGRGDDRKLTCDDDALAKITRRTPLLRPLCERLSHFRSMEMVRKDCDPQMLSEDGRLRTNLNPAYVETFRLSSNETAFGEGTNVQNLKRADRDLVEAWDTYITEKPSQCA